jgi:pentapeptide MXKDX repeat protein
MNRFSCISLALCLAASSGFAFAQNSMTMPKDTVDKDVMSQNSTEKKKSKSDKSNRKVTMERDLMKMKAATDKN